MSVVTKPVSEIIQSKAKDEEEPKKRSREDWRKAKELEEARKAGNAPAAVDEEGKDINPHIPQYISSAPWYIQADGPTLKHQRPQKDREADFARLDEAYKRGLTGQTATRYREGACTNCGALTHKAKECMDRPRKVGAKFSGKAFAPDEILPPSLRQSYDGKRDRWSGYDPSMYDQVVEEYSKIEDAKRQIKEDKLKQDLLKETQKDKEDGEAGESDSDREEDEDEKYADHADMPGTKVDSKQRITVRNLRIREDVAKYLRNLDPDSAYYDPKTRAMRENPYKESGKRPNDLPYAGENFVRYTGDTLKISEAQLFAWQAHEKGVDVHLQAEPTKAELLHKEFRVKKDEFKDDVKKSILERYGGEEHLDAPPKELILDQSERYVEYSHSGKIIKGADKVIIRSIYEEDVYINNHTSVWGSYWQDGRWGYKCCHSFLKNSYCIGEVGKNISNEYINEVQEEKENEEKGEEIEEETKEKSEETHIKQKKEKTHVKDEEASKKPKRKMKEWFMENEDNNERKRPYNSMYETKGPTEDEYEEYQLKRLRHEDPMKNYNGSDEEN